RLLRLRVQTSAEEIRRELRERSRLLLRGVRLPAAGDRLSDHPDRLELVVGEIAGARATFEQLGALVGREVFGEAKRSRVLSGGLAVGAGRRGLLRRDRGPAEHRAAIESG